jgi:hypothetical protein
MLGSSSAALIDVWWKERDVEKCFRPFWTRRLSVEKERWTPVVMRTEIVELDVRRSVRVRMKTVSPTLFLVVGFRLFGVVQIACRNDVSVVLVSEVR